MKIKVNVTQECIDQGLKNDPWHCPIACALIDAGVQNPSVSAVYIVIPGTVIKPSEEVKTFIDHFDKYEHVEPFEFELELDM